MYVVFEGIDFTGKSTKLNETLKVIKEPLVVREPCKYNGELTILRNIIASGNNDGLFKAYLSLAQREWLHRHIVMPAYEINNELITLSDRSFITSCVYQSSNYKELQNVFELNRQWLTHTGIYCVPDIIVYMEVKFDEYLKRKAKANERLRIDKVEEELTCEETFNEYRKRYAYALNLCERYLGSRVLVNPTAIEIKNEIAALELERSKL